MHAIKSRTFSSTFICKKKKEREAQTLTYNKIDWRSHMHHTPHTSQLKHFWWQLSEFSVNMHALWLKTPEFSSSAVSHCPSLCLQLQPPHWTRHVHKFGFDKKKHSEWLSEVIHLLPLPRFTHTCWRAQRSRDTNTSEGEGRSIISSVDWMSPYTKNNIMIWPNSGPLLNNKFLFLLTMVHITV